MTKESSVSSLHQQVGQDFVKLIDPETIVKDRIKLAEEYTKDVTKIDAYIRLSSPCSVAMPSIPWSRKACTLLMWIRPIVDLESSFESSTPKSNIDRVLYRFSTSTDDTQAVGVCVVHDGWKYHDDNTVQTTLTAYSMAPKVQTYANFAQVSIKLKPNQWHLVGFTHYYPYLKKPSWSLVVDGALQGVFELQYPVVDVMEHNLLFAQHCLGGIEKTDDQRAGSELHDKPKKYSFAMDLAAMAIHQDVVPPSLQAVLSQAGPQLSLQTHRIVSLLPSVPNWAKGSSLEGPKVGIPLMVHANALQLQQLASTCLFAATAIDSRILLGSTDPEQQRIVCEMNLLSGQTDQTPRVGLVQPGVPQRVDPDNIPQLYANGKISLFHALSQTILDRDWDIELFGSKHWSLVWHEQDLCNVAILPFFLALPPPGQMLGLSSKQAKFSWRQLHSLYSDDAALATSFIRLFAHSIRHGGARAHEQVLQDGSIHNLSTCLRLSLIRAQKSKAFGKRDVDEWMGKTMDDTIPSQAKNDSCVPTQIPGQVVEACLDLIDACCGPPSRTIDLLSPAEQVQRTSDIALTCVFGFALDWDLWGGDAKAAEKIFSAVSDRFGASCPTSGHILRSQVSVQYLIDCLRVRYDKVPSSPELEKAAVPLCRIVRSILLSSLSNRRSISQGEHDISACVNALSDTTLGSMAAHVVLNSIVGLLAFCEILPLEATLEAPEICEDEELKMHVATRIGRNLLMAQFHDVIAPMVLSRTAYSGESALVSNGRRDGGRLSWESNWQSTLLLFSWVASIAGAEGFVAARTSGSLLYASSLAGSLKGALEGAGKEVLSALFLPPPAMALMIGSVVRDEWSYTDLLSDRLQIMMPFLPGIVVSLLSKSSESNQYTHESLRALSELLVSVAGAFHRVFGGLLHSSGSTGSKERQKDLKGQAEGLKAARVYVPYLVSAAMVLESHLDRLKRVDESPVKLTKPHIANENAQRTRADSWVDVGSDSFVDQMSASLPEGDGDTLQSESVVVSILDSCQYALMNISTLLIVNAMKVGGSGPSISLWQDVLDSSRNEFPDSPPQLAGDSREDAERNDILDPPTTNLVCRLSASVLIKCLKRESLWDVWSFELSSAVSKLCIMVEEKHLLSEPLAGCATYSNDQVRLIGALTSVLEYGRNATGWVQIALPTMSQHLSSKGDLSETSKIFLPVLQPCFRVLSSTLLHLTSSLTVCIDDSSNEDLKSDTEESLLSSVLQEFDATITAAIVGLSFSNARDMALRMLATLRNAATRYSSQDDTAAEQLCGALLYKVADELRERYKAEKRLRETALFDAYDGKDQSQSKTAGAESEVVERLILGGEMFGDDSNQSEEIDFNASQEFKKRVSDDFVLFHEASSSEEKSRLGYAQYEGLASALDAVKEKLGDVEGSKYKNVANQLRPYLDAWDELNRKDSVETELVRLFDSNAQISKDTGSRKGQVAIRHTETAADAMSSFFELSASEKARLMDLSVRFVPGSRYGRIAFAERFCWARFAEVLPEQTKNCFERGMTDGDRDIRSRIPSVPVAPQFRRYIPKYLDHGSENEPTKESEDADAEKRARHERNMTTDVDMKTLLKAANLEIVDITKKDDIGVDEDEPDVTLPSSQDGMDPDDDFYIDSGTESDTSTSLHSKDDLKSEEATHATEESSGLAKEDEEPTALVNDIVGKSGLHSVTSSAFSTPPDNASSSLSLLNSAAASRIELHMEDCLHVKAEGSRQCTMLLTDTHLILEYDGDLDGFFEGELQSAKDEAERLRMAEDVGVSKANGELSADEILQQRIDRRHRDVAASRPKSIRWNLSEISHVYLRRYRLRDSSIEIFFIPSGGTTFGGYGLFSPSSSLFLDFGAGREGIEKRETAAFAIMKRSPPQALKQWPDRSSQFLHDQVSRLTIGWHEGRITNFDYLLHLNMLSGRSYNDICQYPVFPWVLADYESEEIPDLTDPKNFRDLSKPVGALNPDRLAEFLERFETFADPSIPPFMYGSHYSTSAGVVLHFLVRLHPFAGLHRQLQSGHFDVADRLFSSVPRTWGMCTGTSAAEVKELTPEWYCNPAFLRNQNNFKLGTSQDGDVLGDVKLPPWAKGSPERFIEVMRTALESDRCSEMLPAWIDLIFGRKQQGPEAIKANNVFFYLTYYGSVDVNSIKDESLREAIELQIAHFGQCPMQLFRRLHVHRLPGHLQRRTFFQTLSAFSQRKESENGDRVASHNLFGEPHVLPFSSAPLSHWIHLDAPPPGPHSALLAVRLAGVDRCLAIDAKGIFHTFRWAWRSEDSISSDLDEYFDKGCFVAQRELPRFRTIPRLPYVPLEDDDEKPAIAVSKTLFAGRSVLLILSSGDRNGGLAMQLVDPSKGSIRGEVVLPSIHSSLITCIATEPIGTAAGHGGVGGELAIVGSADGHASVWRFMSSHYLPLRPRIRLSGHNGDRLFAVALNTSTQSALTLSSDKCCIHSLGNGAVIRTFAPPSKLLDIDGVETISTKFAKTNALAISSQGLIVAVCESCFRDASGATRTVYCLVLFDMEGLLVGSLPLEPWRGIPSKLQCIPDGTAVFVCCGRGITIHRVSVCHALEIVDEWQVTEADDVEKMTLAHDMDLGPSLNRPVVAAAACSNGILRLHALTGISAWSDRHKKSGLSQSVGTAFASPARRIKSAVRDGWGLGKQIAGMGLDIGREVTSDVKERGVGSFIGSFMKKK